jgi:peptidoglycan/LPS O-acetylase OafA/YrhL
MRDALEHGDQVSQERVKSLDGVRGVAILLVLFVHFTPDPAMPTRIESWIFKFIQAGWIGVDLFFVLSGCLITGILLDAKSSPDYFKNFYMRRMLRIFPLYYGALVVVFLVLPAAGLLGGASFETMRATQLYHWLYLTNVGWYALGTQALFTTQMDLTNFWTLAVEEHFYLVWPAVVYFSTARTVRRVAILLIVSAFAIRCLYFFQYGSASQFYYLTPCRWDSLAAGAFVAAAIREYGLARLRQYIPYAVAAAVVSGLFLLMCLLWMKGLWSGAAIIRTVGLSALALGFAAMIFLVLQLPVGGWADRMVGCGFLRFFGKYCYGLYIIHGLMISFLSYLIPAEIWLSRFSSMFVGSLTLAFLKIAICVPLAMISWHLYEKQFLKLKRYFEYARFNPQRHLGPAASSESVNLARA